MEVRTRRPQGTAGQLLALVSAAAYLTAACGLSAPDTSKLAATLSQPRKLPTTPNAPLPATPFEALAQSGMPTGLLPHLVENFTITDTGDFVVGLKTPCRAVVDFWGGFPIRYESVLTGNIRKGVISKLTGVAAEALSYIIWLQVVEITSLKGQELKFSVTYSTFKFAKNIPNRVFEGEPDCKALVPALHN